MSGGSSGKRERSRGGVRWDETNLHENELIKAELQPIKISEPKTPYHGPTADSGAPAAHRIVHAPCPTPTQRMHAKYINGTRGIPPADDDGSGHMAPLTLEDCEVGAQCAGCCAFLQPLVIICQAEISCSHLDRR